jgi:hypothetical protein
MNLSILDNQKNFLQTSLRLFFFQGHDVQALAVPEPQKKSGKKGGWFALLRRRSYHEQNNQQRYVGYAGL